MPKKIIDSGFFLWQSQSVNSARVRHMDGAEIGPRYENSGGNCAAVELESTELNTQLGTSSGLRFGPC